jgi:hypothetical protein
MDLSTVSFGLFDSNMLAGLEQTVHATRPGREPDEPPLDCEKRDDLNRSPSQALIVLVAEGVTDAK